MINSNQIHKLRNTAQYPTSESCMREKWCAHAVKVTLIDLMLLSFETSNKALISQDRIIN